MEDGDGDEDNVIRLPYYLGEFSINSPAEFLNDLFLSSNGTLVLSVVMLGLLLTWRCCVDDSEEHDDFMESIKQEELKGKWKKHNAKWGTTFVPPAKNMVSSVPLPPITTQIIQTSPLPTHVTIIGDLSKALVVFVTYHDVGLNHRWCFNRLINLMNGADMLTNTAILHIDAPGHEDGSSSIVQKPISLDMLAEQVFTITQQVGVKKFIGLGIGAGANVLLRFSSVYTSKVHGLVLVNPTAKEPSINDRISLSLVKAMMYSRIKFRASSVGVMASIHFSHRALACKSLPRAFAKSYRKPVEWDNKQWFIDSFLSRDALGSSRLRSLSNVPIICFSAHESVGIGFLSNRYVEEDTDSLVTELIVEAGHQRVTHMRIRGCGAQLTEERAEELLQPIKLFAAGLGFSLGR